MLLTVNIASLFPAQFDSLEVFRNFIETQFPMKQKNSRSPCPPQGIPEPRLLIISSSLSLH